jgi:hypothetical protein
MSGTFVCRACLTKTAFLLHNEAKPGKEARRKTAGLTCPDCGEPVEPTPSGNYRHVNSLTGPCGIRIMDVAMRDDGTFTDEDPDGDLESEGSRKTAGDLPPWLKDDGALGDKDAPPDDTEDDGGDAKYEQKKDAKISRAPLDHTARMTKNVTASGDLCDYMTGETIRPATDDELEDSIEAASRDGGAGVIDVDGRSCYVVGRLITADESFAGDLDGTKPAGAAPMVQPGDEGDVAMFEPEIPEPENTAADKTARRRRPFGREGLNDADIEMMELSEPGEPACPGCGGEDTFVSRWPAKQDQVDAIAADAGLSSRDVVICMDCGTVVDNSGRGNVGMIGKVASRKTADITRTRMSIPTQLKDQGHTVDARNGDDGRIVYIIDGEEMDLREAADRYLGGWDNAFGRGTSK